VVDNGRVLTSLVSSQIQLHAEYGGVVPELATREHLRNLPLLVREALQEAGLNPTQLEAIASTQGPGLPGALLVGMKAAQAMAFALRIPYLGIHHHEAHLYSSWITGNPMKADFDRFEPTLALIVSGGHTMLVHVKKMLDHHLLGSTVDDAAGECFDKAAKLMGLPYPGGPVIDRLAVRGNPKAFAFPRPMIHEPNHDFSFSGLKTSVRYFIRDHPEVVQSDAGLCDLCASVQAAIVDVLTVKTISAARQAGVRCVTTSGGVSCNSGLRSSLERACKKSGFHLRLAEKSLCTDNAAMIGTLAEYKLRHGASPTPLDAEPMPGWELVA
jgi:N6-L-threonylcarbamoyladenine synthase